MNVFHLPSVGIGEIVFPVMSFGMLFTALIMFAFLAVHKRDAHIFCSLFALLFGSVLAVGLDAAVLFVGAVFGRMGIARDLYRLDRKSVV